MDRLGTVQVAEGDEVEAVEELRSDGTGAAHGQTALRLAHDAAAMK